MRSALSIRPYRLLARYYDQFFAFSCSRLARRRLLGEILPRARSACDMCCGTGTTALEFARRDIKVFAVDLSPTMCRLARAKTRRAGARVTVIRADMRTFRLPEQVDLITCEFDALNHVPRKADLPEWRRLLHVPCVQAGISTSTSITASIWRRTGRAPGGSKSRVW